METAVQHRAANKYRPLPYHGRVLLLRRSIDQSRWSRARQDWGRLVRGGSEAYDIPGGHGDMFNKPYVGIAAAKLRAALEAARAQSAMVAQSAEQVADAEELLE